MFMSNSNKKLIKFISIICILVIIVLLFIYIYEIYKTRDYIKTRAIITSNIENVDYGLTNDSKSTKYKYVEVKYDNYITKYRVWTFLFKNEGATTTIFYSKENPSMIRDKFKTITIMYTIIILLIFVVGINLSKNTSRNLNSLIIN